MKGSQDRCAGAFPVPGHDHGRCLSAILYDAEATCRQGGLRLTTIRRRVLEIVAASHAAIGAYDIIERLAEGGRPPAPMTVYRALDFLIRHRLVHRLASLNAYVACRCPTAEHGVQFLICRQCGTIGEISDARVDRAIGEAASASGFAVVAPVVELAGLCRGCRDAPDADAAD